MNIPFLCAWQGCDRSFRGDMPMGWRVLITYHGFCPVLDFLAPAVAIERDAMLCPDHAGALEGLLKKIR